MAEMARGVVWISLFLTCGANNCSMVRNERVTFNCKVTFVQDLFHCHVLGGPDSSLHRSPMRL